MANLKRHIGDIQVLVNPITNQMEWISPSNLSIFVGKVDYDENGKKKVVSGALKKLGVFLSEKDEEIKELKEQLKEQKEQALAFKKQYKQTIKGIIKVLEIVVPQMELNSQEMNDLLFNLEEE